VTDIVFVGTNLPGIVTNGRYGMNDPRWLVSPPIEIGIVAPIGSLPRREFLEDSTSFLHSEVHSVGGVLRWTIFRVFWGDEK
jgi:hypothetical protein